MRFTIDDKFFEQIPNAVFGVVAVANVDNTKSYPEIENMLKENISQCEAFYEGKKIKECPEIICYREAMRTLGFNPNKYMCSIEALLTRISKKKGFPTINPIVDLGNAISIKYKVPIEAHDLDSSNEDFYVRPSKETDYFRPFGAELDQFDNPSSEEIVYATGDSIRTRRWIWRQSEEGKITENVTNLMFPIDGFEENKEQVISARNELAEKIQEIFGLTPVVGLIHKDNPSFEIIL